MTRLSIYHNGKTKIRIVDDSKVKRLAQLAGDYMRKYHQRDEWYIHTEKIRDDTPSCSAQAQVRHTRVYEG